MELLEEINQALEYTKQGLFDKSEKIYLRLLKTDKSNIVYSYLGILYLVWAKYEKAEKYLTIAYKYNPSQTITESLAFIKVALCKYKESVPFFSKIIDTTKNYKVLKSFIALMIQDKKFLKAHEYAKKLVQIYPTNPEAISKLIETYIYIGQLKEAFVLSKKLISTHPKHWSGWYWGGFLQEMLFHDDIEAEKYYRKIIELGAKSEGYYNLAISSVKQKKFEQALEYVKKFEKDKNYFLSVLWEKATINMKMRNFKKGLYYYNQFLLNERIEDKYYLIAKLKNFWDGKSYKNETLLIYGDQGCGDLIMFSRFLPQVAKKFKTVKVLVDDELKTLFRYSFRNCKNIKFYDICKIKRAPVYDKSTLLACLPYYLKADLNDIPYSEGYFDVDKKHITKYRDIMNTKKLKVGLCWEAGSTQWREHIHRTLYFSLFDSCLKLEDIQFYSLQVNPAMQDYKKYENLIDLGSDFKDYKDTAGALKNLDLMITVDTSVAHLSGALGVKTFMLLPYCSDWRWFDDTETTGWYDSVKIFKQQDPKSWDEVFDRIEKELKSITTGLS